MNGNDNAQRIAQLREEVAAEVRQYIASGKHYPRMWDIDFLLTLLAERDDVVTRLTSEMSYLRGTIGGYEAGIAGSHRREDKYKAQRDEAWTAGVEAAFESLDGYLASDFDAVLAKNPHALGSQRTEGDRG